MTAAADLPLLSWTPSQARAATDEVEQIPDDVKETFERLALEVKAKGFDRYSADAILHRCRWNAHVERGNREYRINNNWSAPLARWLMNKRPDMAGFFETRVRKGE